MKAQFLFSIHVIAVWSLLGIQPQINPEKGPGQKPTQSSISDAGPVQIQQLSDENVFGINQIQEICPLNPESLRIRYCLVNCGYPSGVNPTQFCLTYCKVIEYIAP